MKFKQKSARIADCPWQPLQHCKLLANSIIMSFFVGAATGSPPISIAKGEVVLMPKKNWTKEQGEAIYDRGGTLLISAAAGSGKTAVLTERVISKITNPNNPIDIDKLLIVTFTKAAAAEMKERISLRLAEIIAENPNEKWLHRQQMLLQKANISTIHSFCSSFIRENFQYIGVSPDFRIAEESELQLIKLEIVDEILEEQYAKIDDNSQFSSLVELLSSGRDDKRLTATIFQLFDFLRSHPFPKQWLCEKADMYNIERLEDTVWCKIILEYAKNAVDYAITLIKSALKTADENEQMGKAYGDCLDTERVMLEAFRRILDANNWVEAYSAIHSLSFGRLGQLKKFEDEELKERVTDARNDAKKIINTLKEDLFSMTDEECIDDLKSLSPIVKCLFDIVIEFNNRLWETKVERKILDFGDLEQLTLKLLINDGENNAKTDIAIEFSKRFEEILVDEYQDTNEVQDTIFKAISRNETNLFMVGDVKQSVYRFRQAMPEIFISKKNSFHYLGDGYPSKIILSNNFRSRKGVTDIINFIFKQLMTTKLGEMEYSKDEELISAAVYPQRDGADAALHIIQTADEDESGDTVEARYIADLIRKTVDSGYQITENGVLRPAEYKDITILLRSPRGRSEIYIRELSAKGIPVWADIAGGYFSAYEVAVVISLLRVLDNILQDIPLTAVMISPIFGFSFDEMAKIRLANRSTPLFMAVKMSAELGDKKCIDFLQKIDEYRRIAATLSADILLLRLYEETGFLSAVQAMKDGERRSANLLKLLDYAKKYESAGFKGLTGFVGFIDRLIEQDGDLAPASTLVESGNVVKIMSIHRSKGLEFPICMLAGCSKKFNKMDIMQAALLHPRLGFGTKLQDSLRLRQHTTLPLEAIKLEILSGMLSEEMRVLYVALTRASEKLIMTLTSENIKSRLTKAAMFASNEKISPFAAMGANGFSDWILACVIRHPNAIDLRKIAGLDEDIVLPAAGEFEIVISNGNENKIEKLKILQENEIYDNMDNDINIMQSEFQPILDQFAWEYLYKELSKIPSKVAVAQFTEKFEIVEIIPKRPQFLTGVGLTGSEAGTALHHFMQFSDYSRLSNQEGIRLEIERLVTDKFITPQEGEVIDVLKVIKFFSNTVAKRMMAACKVYREFRFNIEIPANQNYPDLKLTDECILVQGVADCIFEEEAGLVILDYKTDRITNDIELKNRYSKQIDLYARAVSEILQKPVVKKYIYSFKMGCEIEV
jgi:ATP-dependent helicase/nuclease subunit A